MGGGCNDAPLGKAPLSAAEVGGSFVLQYYTTLTTDKENLHKYYKDESICSRGIEGASPDQITYAAGIEEIREEIRTSSGLSASRTEINCIQSQESKQGGILVLVLGYFVYADSRKVHFSQVFFLTEQTEPCLGYFVLNDILRYVTGKPENSGQQADSASPLLPPAQPPMLPTPKGAEAEEATQAKEAAQIPVPPPEEPAAEEEEEEEVAEAVEEAADEPADDPEECEEDAQGQADAAATTAQEAADAATAQEAAAAAAAEEASEPIIVPEEKRSWASMAATLKDSGGQLGKSKVQGFALPASAKAKASTSPPTAAPRLPAPSGAPVLPPPTAAAKAKAKAAVAAEEAGPAGDVRLWLSRIPTDANVENQELLDCLNKLIADSGVGGTVEIERKDLTKEWAYVTVPSQDVADLLVQHSKDRKVMLRGKSLKVEQKGGSNRRSHNNSGNAGGKGGHAAEDGGESKAADGGAGSRGPRRGKGAKGEGGKGGKSGADAGSPSEKQERSSDGPSRSRGGGRREKGGGEKGAGGNWRSQS